MSTSANNTRIQKILSHLSCTNDNNQSNIRTNHTKSKSFKILLCGTGYPLFPDIKKQLSALGHSVTLLPDPVNSKQAAKDLYQHIVIAKNIDYEAILKGWGTFSTSIKGAILPNLKVLSCPSSGIPYDDILYCKKHKIALTNTPSATADTTADLAVGLMIATARQFYQNTAIWKTHTLKSMASMKNMNGIFSKCGNAKDLHGSTVGIIGLGNIGRQISKRLSKGFGCKVLYFNGVGKKRKSYDAQYGAQHMSSFDELILQSDFVVAICPLMDSTRHMFNARVFTMMKNDAIFINVGRGGLCDTNALIKALKYKWIGGAGLDVTDPEPLPKDHELWTLDNVTILPHIGTSTVKCRTKMMNLAVDNMLQVLNNEPCSNNIIV